MTPLVSELRHRRVFQFLGLYLGASWAVIQFVDFLVKRYLLSQHLTDATLITLMTLTPAVILLAYYLGAPGRQTMGRVGKIGVPVNVLVTAVLVTLFLGSRDLSAAAKEVTVTDEDGREVTRLVPTQSAMRKVTVFFWDNETRDADNDWLGYGLTALLMQDLRQNPFISVTSVSGSSQGGGLFNRLVRAGYEDGVRVPLALKKRLAQDWNLQYFISGELVRAGEELEAQVAAYETKTGRKVADHRVTGTEPGELVDEVTPLLTGAFDAPGTESGLVEDLPVAEIFTDEREALRHYVAGALARLKRNDFGAAAESLGKAVEIDPSFAMAQSQLAQVLFANGDSAGSAAAIEAALKHDYKLLEADRFVVKGSKYLIENQVDKQIALYEMWVELQPDDLRALGQLANTYLWFGNRIGDAKALFYRIFDLYPAESWALQRIADLALVEGEANEAITALNRYLELHPDVHTPLIRIGRIHRSQGDLDAAKASFERAQLMASGFIQPSIELADLALRRGELDEADRFLAEAEGIATDASQRHTVMQARIDYHRFRGEFETAFGLVGELGRLSQQVYQPVDHVLSAYVQNLELYAANGRLDEVEQLIDAWIERLGEPFGSFLHIGSMFVALERERPAAAGRHRQVVEAALAAWNKQDMGFITELGRGRELSLGGDYDGAIAAFENGLQLFTTSIQSSGADDSMTVDLLRRLGEMHRRAGDPKRARARLEEALRLAPALPDAHLELARVYRDLGEPAQARQHLDQALEVWRFADESCPGATAARELDRQISAG